MSEPVLQVKGLKTYYYTEEGVVPAVDGLDFEVEPGETFAIVGESGCGKSVTSLSIPRRIANPCASFAAASSVSSALFPSANFSATNSPSSAWCWCC